MKLAICFASAALSYLFILGYALVWNRGANRRRMPKPASDSRSLPLSWLKDQRISENTSPRTLDNP
jgi:hypothetical protein